MKSRNVCAHVRATRKDVNFGLQIGAAATVTVGGSESRNCRLNHSCNGEFILYYSLLSTYYIMKHHSRFTHGHV
jgi:hypothetical protein